MSDYLPPTDSKFIDCFLIAQVSTHQYSTESNYTELLTGLEEGLFDAPEGDRKRKKMLINL